MKHVRQEWPGEHRHSCGSEWRLTTAGRQGLAGMIGFRATCGQLRLRPDPHAEALVPCDVYFDP